jgi:prevent-host-death family protein
MFDAPILYEHRKPSKYRAYNLTLILDTVGFGGDAVVVEKNGERLAAIVPIQMLDKWEEERKAFSDQMREVSAQADVPYEEALELAAEAVQAVRTERQGGQLSPF